MEFLCPEDNAWYDVDLFFDGKKLTVHYNNFTEEYDEKYDSKMFNNMEKLEEFTGRFRLSSVQVQDHECELIYKGKTVCASCHLDNNEVKFYDAVVVEVLNLEHKQEAEAEEEECSCTYVVAWLHGPLVGERTFAEINDICFIPINNGIDSSLRAFLRIARGRIEYEQHCNLAIPAYFKKIRRLRKNRCASKTVKERRNGSCKKIEFVTFHEDASTSSS